MNDHDEHSDNIFDEDDPLDYIMYEQVEQKTSKQLAKSGCLLLFALPILPIFTDKGITVVHQIINKLL
jgi:hypothetical protein